jgi:hypothetical protein
VELGRYHTLFYFFHVISILLCDERKDCSERKWNGLIASSKYLNRNLSDYSTILFTFSTEQDDLAVTL